MFKSIWLDLLMYTYLPLIESSPVDRSEVIDMICITGEHV